MVAGLFVIGRVVGFSAARAALEILTLGTRVKDAVQHPIFAKLPTAWRYLFFG